MWDVRASVEIPGFELHGLSPVFLENPPRSVLDSRAICLEGTDQIVGRWSFVAKMVVQRVQRHAAPDVSPIDIGFEGDARRCHYFTASGEFDPHNDPPFG